MVSNLQSKPPQATRAANHPRKRVRFKTMGKGGNRCTHEMDSEARTQFLSEVDRRLRIMYRSLTEEVQHTRVDRARLSGFIQAGIYLGLTNKSELNDMVSRIELEELGEDSDAPPQRKFHKWRSDETDYSSYESPAYERNRGRSDESS